MTASSPCLVYLPGLEGTGQLLFQQTRLFQHYEVHGIAYPQNRAGTFEELADQAAVPLEKAGSGIVLAESFGGVVALTLALQKPELIQRLILVNTFAYFPRRPVIEALAWMGRFLQEKPSPSTTRKFREHFFFSPDVPASTRVEWWKRTGVVPMGAMGRRLQLVKDVDLRPQLSVISVPSLVLVSRDDRVVPPGAGMLLAQRLPHARLLRLRVGHAALVHPQVDVACLLGNKEFWPNEVLSRHFQV